MNRANAAAHTASPGVALLPRIAVVVFTLLFIPGLSSAGTNPVFQLTGSRAGGTFGQLLGSPGDVNGDGYPDLLVGATGFNTPGPGGKVYLFFGGAAFDTIPDVVFDLGEFLFGMARRPTDLNGDGRPDIVLCGGSLNHPEVRVYYGRPQVSTTPDMVLRSPTYFWRTLASLDGSVDVDGDGYDDLVVGWPVFEVVDGNSQRFGVVSIYRGGPTFDDVPDWKLESNDILIGSEEGAPFGECVGPVGDFNGDGHPDLGVYKASRFNVDYRFGHIFVYDGGPGFDTAADVTLRAIISPMFNDSRVFSTVGDLDGDGLDEIATQGTFFSSDSTSDFAGHDVWIYHGGTGATPWPPDAVLTGPTDLSGPLFGDADVTGDGRRDLVVGSSSPGANRVLLMETRPLDSQPDITIAGHYPEFYGYDVTAVDATGDGVPDLVVGAPWAATEIGAKVGRVAIYDLARPLPARAFLRGDHRVLALTPSQSEIRATFRIQLEPADGAFDVSAIDHGSIRLESPSTGDVDTISPVGSKTLHLEDSDGDGVSDLSVDFKRSDLEHLFALVRGRRVVTGTLSGRLLNRRRFQASLNLTVVAGSGSDAASVEPNPLNPVGSIVFDMPHPGRVTAKVYDVRGRRIRTLVDGQAYPEGSIRIPIDGRDARGAGLASGIYFYRIEAPNGSYRGRFVVTK